MAQPQATPVLGKLDPVWARVRREAEDIVRREPELATFIYSTILHHDSLEDAIVHRLAERLDHPALSGELIRQAYADALREVPAIGEIFRADLMATVDRDPATHRFTTNGAGSVPKKAFVQGTVPVTVFCTQRVSAP